MSSEYAMRVVRKLLIGLLLVIVALVVGAWWAMRSMVVTR